MCQADRQTHLEVENCMTVSSTQQSAFDTHNRSSPYSSEHLCHPPAEATTRPQFLFPHNQQIYQTDCQTHLEVENCMTVSSTQQSAFGTHNRSSPYSSDHLCHPPAEATTRPQFILPHNQQIYQADCQTRLEVENCMTVSSTQQSAFDTHNTFSPYASEHLCHRPAEATTRPQFIFPHNQQIYQTDCQTHLEVENCMTVSSTQQSAFDTHNTSSPYASEHLCHPPAEATTRPQFIFPHNQQIYQTDCQTRLEVENCMSVSSTQQSAFDTYDMSPLYASGQQCYSLAKSTASPQCISPADPVQGLMQFFKALLLETDAIDRSFNAAIDQSLSERIKRLIHLLVNSEIPIDQFAAFVERTVKANAAPNLLPFLHRTVPAFIEAIAQCRINVEYLLPHYLKPFLQPTETRSYQDYSTPSRETPAAVVPVYPEATCELSVHSLHPNCDSSQTASCENTFRESLSELFLHPYGMLASIQKCMSTSFYVEEEALQLISYAAENHIREILIEMSDVAAHRVKGLFASQDEIRLHVNEEKADHNLCSGSRHIDHQSRNVGTETVASSYRPSESRVTIAGEGKSDISMKVEDCNTEKTTSKAIMGKTARRITSIGRVYKAHEREPEKTYRKVVRVIASDLQTVVLGDKRLFGRTTEQALSALVYTSSGRSMTALNITDQMQK